MKFNPKENYRKTRKLTAYISRDKANQETYDKIGFKSMIRITYVDSPKLTPNSFTFYLFKKKEI